MAALQCDICGGKLIGRPRGIFECDSCGMQYDTAWAKEKIQEIKGTVKVEGTVQVAGTVKVDGPVQVKGGVNIDSLLMRGRMALEDGKWEEAKKFFDRVLNMDAKRAEAHWGLLCAQYKQTDLSGLLETKYKAIRTDKDYQRALNLSDDGVKNRAANREQEYQQAEADAKARFERKSQELEVARKRIRPARQLFDISQNMFFGVMTDGTVCMCGTPGYYEQKIVNVVSAWKDICAICVVANEDTLFGLKNDGSIVAAGRDSLVQAVAKWTDIAAIYSAPWQLVGLKKDGTVVVSGGNWYHGDEEPAITEWKDIADIYTDGDHIYGIRVDGRVLTVSSKYGEQNMLASWRNIVGLSKYLGRMVGLKADGTMTTEGNSNVKDWMDVVGLFRDTAGDVFGLKKDGTLLLGSGIFVGERDVVAIRARFGRILMLKADGTIVFQGSDTMTRYDGTQVKLNLDAVRGWKLFENIDKLAQEREAHREEKRFEKYQRACKLRDARRSLLDLHEAERIFRDLGDYRDCEDQIRKCSELYPIVEKETKYLAACAKLSLISRSNVESAKKQFEELGDWKDSREKVVWCEEKIRILQEIDRLHTKRKELRNERAELGIFAGKRKKEIAAEIQQLDEELVKLEEKKELR